MPGAACVEGVKHTFPLKCFFRDRPHLQADGLVVRRDGLGFFIGGDREGRDRFGNRTPDLTLLDVRYEPLSEEVTMRCKLSPGSESEQPLAGARKGPWILPATLAVSAILAAVTLLSFAQTPAPQLPTTAPRPPLLEGANRPPDANQQMEMREKKSKRQNFDAANAERLRQMTQETEMLETMAIALKAEVDKSGSTPLSENAVRKAETIEKLAQIIKERMQLTVKPN